MLVNHHSFCTYYNILICFDKFLYYTVQQMQSKKGWSFKSWNAKTTFLMWIWWKTEGKERKTKLKMVWIKSLTWLSVQIVLFYISVSSVILVDWSWVLLRCILDRMTVYLTQKWCCSKLSIYFLPNLCDCSYSFFLSYSYLNNIFII